MRKRVSKFLELISRRTFQNTFTKSILAKEINNLAWDKRKKSNAKLEAITSQVLGKNRGC